MEILVPDISTRAPLRLFASAAQAGFPSPAEDYVEGKLDLNTHLIRRPVATFLVRAVCKSMIGAGIYPGDILVVDRSLTPLHGLDIDIARRPAECRCIGYLAKPFKSEDLVASITAVKRMQNGSQPNIRVLPEGFRLLRGKEL